jgi:small subunit ribosomal protein S3Ae
MSQSSQAKLIRRKMTETMTREAETCDLKELVAKFIPESIGREIEKACQGIYPLQNVFIRKAKVLKAPKFDITKLMEVHQGAEMTTGGAVGDRLDRPAELIPEAEAQAEIEGAY